MQQRQRYSLRSAQTLNICNIMHKLQLKISYTPIRIISILQRYIYARMWKLLQLENCFIIDSLAVVHTLVRKLSKYHFGKYLLSRELKLYARAPSVKKI